MTFLMSTEGHDFFFKQPEEAFNAAAAYRFTVTTFGPGVVYDAEPKIMYQQFGFFRYGLDAKKYVSYCRLIQEETQQYFRDNWGNNGTKCMFTALNELFTFTSARCLLGPEVRALWKSEYAEAYQDLDKSFIPILFFFPNFPHPFSAKCLKARKHFETLFMSVLEKRRQEGQDAQYDDFLQVLVESHYKDGSPLSIQEVTGIMMGVLLGGQHTSNVTGTWLIMHLLNSPEWMKRVMEEQKEILGDSTGFADFDQVDRMVILRQCLDETLRLHPPFFQLARRVLQDVEYKGTIIPEGRLVCVSPGATMRLDSIFPNGSEFDPSRFAPEKQAVGDHAYFPFGGGRHQCTGRKFAITSIKTATSWILRNYNFETVKNLPLPDYTTMVVAPTHAKGQCNVTYVKKN